MADRLSPQRLLILWTMPEEYDQAVAPSRRAFFLGSKKEADVPAPAEPEGPAPTADETPVMPTTQAAYEAFSGIDKLMGDADEFIGKARDASPDLTGSEALPLRVEYRVRLRSRIASSGIELSFAAGFADTIDREALLPRFLVLGNDLRAGETVVRDQREGGPGVTFHLSMIEYCALVDELAQLAADFGEAADLPLPDAWFDGTKLLAFLTDRALAHPAVASAWKDAG